MVTRKAVETGQCDSALDCHLCGICSAQFYDVDKFIEHKKSCKARTQEPESPLCSDIESAPIDLSTKQQVLAEFDTNILEDKSNFLLDPFQSIQNHQKQLLELYAQLAASGSGAQSDSEQSSEDGYNTSSNAQSPPFSNDTSDRIHSCMVERCKQRFSSRGALLWHILRRHPGDKLLQCTSCEDRFSDPEQVHEHRCGHPQRSASTGVLERASSPDADRSSVPARINDTFNLVAKSPTPIPNTNAPLSRMLLNQLLGSAGGPSLAPAPSTSLKETALDLSNPVNNAGRHFLPMPPLPHQLLRPSFNFGFPGSQRSNSEMFMNGAQSSSLLNNDDDWEALMEVSTTDESEKIRALVGDKVLPTTDPNQCMLCRRVLSCKSALQMHYRTHTGERPFKCKICQRAFTTKGNLKTHMGVHRAKHSFRGIAAASVMQQQCPICQKRFFNAQMLQQHIAHHTSQLARNGIMPSPFEIPITPAGFDRRSDLPTSSTGPTTSANNNSNPLAQMSAQNLMLSLKNDFVSSPFMPPFPFFPLSLPQSIANPAAMPSNSVSNISTCTPTSSNPALPEAVTSLIKQQQQQTKEITKSNVRMQRSDGLEQKQPDVRMSSSQHQLGLDTVSNLFGGSSFAVKVEPTISSSSCVRDDEQSQTDDKTFQSVANISSIQPTASSSSNSCIPIDSDNSDRSMFHRQQTTNESEKSVRLSDSSQGNNENSVKSGSTDYEISNYLSDSQLRQLFQSTRGVLHQPRSPNDDDDHSMDETLVFDNTDRMDRIDSTGSTDGTESISAGQIKSEMQIDTKQRSHHHHHHHHNDEKASSSGSSSSTSSSSSMCSSSLAPTMGTTSTPNPLDAMQKMWAETEPPPPRQAPVLSKHQCGVCFKHFSSSSALQIHMRTHTGDKPFKCEVCCRAFTTRGNLKVHMSTHMWQQSPSRRGRRIFEFGSEGVLRPEMLPFSGTDSMSAIRAPAFTGEHHQMRSSGKPPPSTPSLTRPPTFPVLPFPLPLLPAVSAGSGTNPIDAVMWMWKTVCSVCQKMCVSPQELEQHLKMHLNCAATSTAVEGSGVGTSSIQSLLLQNSE